MKCTTHFYYLCPLHVPAELFCASLVAVDEIELLNEVLPEDGSAIYFLPVMKKCCGHFLSKQVYQKCVELL